MPIINKKKNKVAVVMGSKSDYPIMKDCENILKTFNKRKRSKNKWELREDGVGAQILSLLQINKIILLTNTKKRIIALDGFNIEIVDQRKIWIIKF